MLFEIYHHPRAMQAAILFETRTIQSPMVEVLSYCGVSPTEA